MLGELLLRECQGCLGAAVGGMGMNDLIFASLEQDRNSIVDESCRCHS